MGKNETKLNKEKQKDKGKTSKRKTKKPKSKNSLFYKCGIVKRVKLYKESNKVNQLNYQFYI
jgi:hypothetical protein